jgi:DNA excision repair protein ERCC-4
MPLLSSSSSVTVLPAYQLLVHPLAHLHSLLARYSPEYVLLFDPDIAAVRALETFQAHPATPGPIKCFFLMYSNSLEEQRYIASIEQENKAFDQLIHTKKNMVVPLEQDGRLPERDERSRIDGSGNMSAEERRNSNLYEDGTRNNTYEAYAATLPNKSDTRRGGAGMDAPGTVLVDVREFRSSLPSQLHAANLVLQPLTLEIADYILTPTLAVERKSVPDLVGSLASGRLYKQMEQAIRYYKTPVLLIEFDRGRPFLLQSKADLTGDISSRSVLSRLVLLMLHFPQMRLLWSRDSHATTRLFLALKARQSQPTLEQAVVANSHSLRSVQNQAGTINEFVDASVGAGMTDEEREDAQLSLTPHDILRKLPGVNAVNIRGLLQHVSNLRELSECTLAQLTSWMGGAIAAKKLHTFLHDDLTSKIA